MLDLDPGLRGAYEQYRAVKAAKSAALARINGRMDRLANMPLPLNTLINIAQLFGFEYEYHPQDMREVYENDDLMLMYQQDIVREWGRTPGEYPLSSLWYHPNLMINVINGRPQPWVAYFSTQIEGDHFSVDLKAESVLARRTKEEPKIQVRAGDAPILSLPDGYRMRLCTEPDWRCQDDYVPCQSVDRRVTKLTGKPQLLTPPNSTELK